MIHHLSFQAMNPLRVANVLAEIWGGKAVPFPIYPGSYVVLTMDEHGTLIEIYPTGTELIPGCGQEQVIFSHNSMASLYTGTHLAISVPADQKQIEQIAAREGWRCVRCDRDGFFEVIELWVENRLMVELLPPALVPKYLNFMQPANLKKFLTSESAQLATVG